MPKPLIALLATVLVAFGVSHYSDRMDPYFLDVLTGIGISIILAVSLNLVNGYTGQFSLGHAGFMAVGAYYSAMITTGVEFPLLTESIFRPVLNPLIFGVNHIIAYVHGLPEIPQFLLALLSGGCF